MDRSFTLPLCNIDTRSIGHGRRINTSTQGRSATEGDRNKGPGLFSPLLNDNPENSDFPYGDRINITIIFTLGVATRASSSNSRAVDRLIDDAQHEIAATGTDEN